MSDLIERLLSLADCDSRAGEPLGKCMREAAAQIARLTREKETAERGRDEARAALEPFVSFTDGPLFDLLYGAQPDSATASLTVPLSVLRRARALRQSGRASECEAEIARVTDALNDARRVLLNIDGYLRDTQGLTHQHRLRQRISRALGKIGAVPDLNRFSANEIARLTREKDTAEAALRHVKTWAEAYPVKVFTPLSGSEEDACTEALDAAVNAGCDRMHASWARHLLTGIGEVADAALRQSESGDRA